MRDKTRVHVCRWDTKEENTNEEKEETLAGKLTWTVVQSVRLWSSSHENHSPSTVLPLRLPSAILFECLSLKGVRQKVLLMEQNGTKKSKERTTTLCWLTMIVVRLEVKNERCRFTINCKLLRVCCKGVNEWSDRVTHSVTLLLYSDITLDQL